MTTDRKIKRHQIAEQFIFSWLPEKNTARTLISFSILSCVIHFLVFYLFKVVYPDQDLPELRPDRITLLDPGRDDVRSFMERLSDRVVFLDPPSKDSISRVKLSDYAIRFVPSFAEARPTLKDTGVTASYLKYPTPEIPLRTKVENWNNRVIFSPVLMKRGIAPTTILDDYLSLISNIPKIRVNLTVKPDGTPVDVYVSDEGINEKTKNLIAESIQSLLRFNPTDSTLDDPGWLILGSESEID